LTDLWHAVEDEARRIITIGNRRNRRPLSRLGASLETWSVCIERLAVSGPSHHLDTLQGFDDHPMHGQPRDHRWRYRESADVLAFVGIGDLVLDDLARAILASRNRTAAHHTNAWWRLVVAADDPATPPPDHRRIRMLQVSLRDARHRMLAHRRVNHAEIVAWETDDSPTVTLVGLDLGRRSRVAIAALNATLTPPFSDELVREPQRFLEGAIGRAAVLSSDQLALLTAAMAETGYVSFPVATVVTDLLGLSAGLVDTRA
jgi:hypothetical protein